MLAEQGLVDVLFPEYLIYKALPSDDISTKNRHELLALSHAFPGGTLSLITHQDNQKLPADDLSILHNKIVGVVRGYTHTIEIDKLIKNRYFSVVEAVDELQLVKLLAEKRVDYIIGDRAVFSHSVNITKLSPEKKQSLLSKLNYLEPEIAEHPLFFALSKKKPNWQLLLKDINEALLLFNSSGVTQRFINAEFNCYQPINISNQHIPVSPKDARFSWNYKRL
jgi:polar amino acid transport system substrate-binding protein